MELETQITVIQCAILLGVTFCGWIADHEKMSEVIKIGKYRLITWGASYKLVAFMIIAIGLYQLYIQNKLTIQNKVHEKQSDLTFHKMSEDLKNAKNYLGDTKEELKENRITNSRLGEQNDYLLKSGHKIQQGEQALFDQNKVLIDQLNDYKTQLLLKDRRIDYLQKSISAAKRGMYKTISLKGMVSSGNHGGGKSGSTSSESKKEMNFFQELDKVEKSKDAKKLLQLSQEAIKFSPEWMTGYLYKAFALFNLGRRDEAMQLFLMVEENTVGDPEFTSILSGFYQDRGDTVKVRQLRNDYMSLH